MVYFGEQPMGRFTWFCPKCDKHADKMALYVKLAKSWRRIGWICHRCGYVEFTAEFPLYRW